MTKYAIIFTYFKPRGDIFGDIVYEYRFCNPSLIKVNDVDDFSNGFVTLDVTDKEFKEMIYVPDKDEKLSEVMKESTKETKEYQEGSTDKELDEIFEGMNEPESEVDIIDDIDDDDLFS